MLQKKVSSKERRKKAINEIFYFYTKQHVISNTKKSFEGVNQELNQLTVAYFLKLLKDFLIPLDQKVIYIPLLIYKYRKQEKCLLNMQMQENM